MLICLGTYKCEAGLGFNRDSSSTLHSHVVRAQDEAGLGFSCDISSTVRSHIVRATDSHV